MAEGPNEGLYIPSPFSPLVQPSQPGCYGGVGREKTRAYKLCSVFTLGSPLPLRERDRERGEAPFSSGL